MLVALAATSSVRASFSGNDLQYTYFFPDNSSIYEQQTVLVGTGIERTVVGGFPINMDISDNNILIDFSPENASTSWTASPFNGFQLFDINNTISAITSVTVNGATTMAGFTSSDISFDANNIYVNWAGLAIAPTTIVSLDVGFADAAPVPEPSTIFAGGLLALPFGLQGIRWLRNRKQIA